jgi:hypothetical protein
VTKAIRFQSNLPLIFWGDCILHAAYLINRLPTAVLQNKTPFETLMHTAPTYSHLKVFGCLSYASNLSSHRTKFDTRAIPCVFIGYPFGVKGFKLFDMSTKQFFVFRDLVFQEHIFPFYSKTSLLNPSSSSFHVSDSASYLSHPLLHPTNITAPPGPSLSPETFSSYHESPFSSISPVEPPTSPPQFTTDASLPTNTYPDSSMAISSPLHPSSQSPMDSSSPISFVPVRKSSRLIKVPFYLQTYHCNLTSSTSTSPSSHEEVIHPIEHQLSYYHLSDSHKAFTLALSTHTEPQFYHEALHSPQWCEAMSKELIALEANHT